MSRAHPYIPQGVNQQGRTEPVTVEQESIAIALAELTAHIGAGLFSVLAAYGLARLAELLLDLELPL